VFGAYGRDHPDRLRFAAVVEPDGDRREWFARDHAIPSRLRFMTVEEALAAEVEADAWIIAMPDRHHAAPAIAVLAHGYDVLLEKPMAADPAAAAALVRAAQTSGRILGAAHVLRYTPFFQAIHRVIVEGRLGDVVTVEHRENVVAWHMAHSFVRGNWAREAEATPMIVQKCCHDFDILSWNLPARVARLSSVGSLVHFRPENAPPGATARCTDGCPVDACPFDARRIYLDERRTGWPVHVITDDLSRAGRLRALAGGPYGRCVYTAGSDVVDHQVVTMQLEDGASVVLVMHGHSHEEGRTMRYDGTRATLRAVFGRRQEIQVIDHASGRVDDIPIAAVSGGHGGGDRGLIEAFVEAVRTRRPLPTSAAEAIESHLLAFAAEEARISGGVVDMAAYRSRWS
jgi:predicted dehydrogenase